jgi:hypothetical protein
MSPIVSTSVRTHRLAPALVCRALRRTANVILSRRLLAAARRRGVDALVICLLALDAGMRVPSARACTSSRRWPSTCISRRRRVTCTPGRSASRARPRPCSIAPPSAAGRVTTSGRTALRREPGRCSGPSWSSAIPTRACTLACVARTTAATCAWMPMGVRCARSFRSRTSPPGRSPASPPTRSWCSSPACSSTWATCPRR